uniref:G-protein coupled receptors family 3 profile domain-containing protein n=1 Tax=Pseudonaja textilis TaxID=8673 RepID=A0A670ZQF1_PSETE
MFLLMFLVHRVVTLSCPASDAFLVPHECVITKFHQHILALAFAVKEINEDSQILPNITPGFHIYDSYNNPRMTYRTTLGLLFKSQDFVLNYKCNSQKNLMAIIGGLDFDTSFYIELNRIPLHFFKLIYGSLVQEEFQTSKLSSLYFMVPKEEHQYTGIIQLLHHFRWTWIGIFAVDNNSGENFLQKIQPLLSQNGICSSFIQSLSQLVHLEDYQEYFQKIEIISINMMKSKANVFLVYGESSAIMWLRMATFIVDPESKEVALYRKVWIMTAQIDFVLSGFQNRWDLQMFHGAISFNIHSTAVVGFKEFLQTINPLSLSQDGFLQDVWEQSFECSFLRSDLKEIHSRKCTGEMKLEDLPGPIFEMEMTGQSYSIYNAVYVVAHALQTLLMQRYNVKKPMIKKPDCPDFQAWQVFSLLWTIVFRQFDPNNQNTSKEIDLVKQKINLSMQEDLVQKVKLAKQNYFENANKPGRWLGHKIKKNKIKTLLFKTFYAYPQDLPLSQCNDPCFPGSWKKGIEGNKFCCYDCFPCPEGKISNQNDYYPDKEKKDCILKTMVFLTFEETLGISLSSATLCFFFLTSWVFGTFIKQRNTPIVKANNRSLTYTLLVSLQLCFLSSLFFLSQPGKVTCLLRQSMFGITFSVAISSVLAKTITVVVAFMATKPGSQMRKWVGKRLAFSIVLLCSLFQVCICILWLSTSPPFPELDMHSEIQEMSLQCNEGSAFFFYCVLGYMGILAISSFIVAFLARKLPDSFNEAKFITFSMLAFCSIWMSFFPAYLSTKGKAMVVVEVFSILVSSAALLGCIFLPKCYIIVFRPELNQREKLIRKN